MNYYNTHLTMDHDDWVEYLKKKYPDADSDFKEDESAKFDFRQTTPERPPNPNNDWAYFITLAFPINHKFKIKHVELRAQGTSRIVFNDIKYGDCTQREQYEWLVYILRKHVHIIADKYDLFFEQTQLGNIHIHGRLQYDNKKAPKKDVKAIFHRMFDVPTKYVHFVDIKAYDKDKWSAYDQKTTKTYQTLEYDHFKNI